MQQALRQLCLLALFLPCLAGCNIEFGMRNGSSTRQEGVRLAELEDKDGTRSEWHLYPGRGEAPRIELTQSTLRIVPRIGATLVAVSRERAESVGSPPWTGVWVEQVDPQGAAFDAGLRAGDIVMTVAGVNVNSPEQFADLLETNGLPGEPLDMTATLQPRRNLDVDRTPTELEVIPSPGEVRSSKTDSIELDHSPGVQSFTGLQAAEVPAPLAQSIFGENRPVVLVSGILSGSPAYDAGFRMGDRVRQCDGSPVNTLVDLRRAVAERTRERYSGSAAQDLAGVQLSGTGSRPRALQLAVDGPLGPHTAEMKVTEGLEDSSDFHIPILVDYDANISRKSISFLDFIFQFGFNYRSRIHPSSNRDRLKTSELSILPLGMFEVEHGLTSSRYRLFWIISWRTRRG